MIKPIIVILTLSGMSLPSLSVLAEENHYILWTFDDFDSNCKVIETVSVDPEILPSIVDNLGRGQAGELGW